MATYQSINHTANLMTSDGHAKVCRVGNSLVSALFVIKTTRAEWLNNWGDTRVFEASNEYALLPSLMSSLRAIAGIRSQQPTVALATSNPNERGLDPEAYCTRYRQR